MKNTLKVALGRWCAVLTIMCLLNAATPAYTLLMRGGRKVEIPDRFTATGTTLTYEAAPGINVTLQLSQIDIAATERLNGEAPGGLLRRGAARSKQLAAPQLLSPAQRASKSLTNRELESARRVRLESERAYERRRMELGLPPPFTAEPEEIARGLRESGREYEAEQRQAEAYWRARASALREELRALDAEIAYVRSALNETAGPPSYGFVTGLILVGRPGFGYPHAPTITTPRAGALIANNSVLSARMQSGRSITFGGGQTRGQVTFNRHNFGDTLRRRAVVPHPGAFAVGVFALTAPFNYYGATRDLLLGRLSALESSRAGYDERWRVLEEEARRAGALPGWLRP
ncbi:MAG: hypothetical protein ACRD9R_03890 [Pyrinomonadaceae bacterium]